MSDLAEAADVTGRRRRVENGLIHTRPSDRTDSNAGRLTERMARLAVPGVSVAVINGGAVEWAQGYGVRAAGGEEAVTADTLFQAASISKPVTAVAVMHLVQERRLDLNEDVNAYLRGWRVPANGSWQPRLTLRDLLSHSGGTTVQGFPGYRRGRRLPTLRQILDGEAPANTDAVRVDTLPGIGYRYSGGGTTIVQHMLVDVTGMPFPALMRDLVLRPLGMDRSTFEQPLPPDRWGTAATGHRAGGESIPEGWHIYPEMAAAGLWTTPAEVALLALEVQQAREGEGRILSRASVDQMLTPQAGGPFGIGFELAGEGAALRFGHTGDNEGFRCELMAYANRGLGAVVMTNGDLGGQLCSEVLGTVAQEYRWPLAAGDRIGTFAPPHQQVSADPSILAGVAGAYELRPDTQLRVVVAGDALTLHFVGQPPIRVVPVSAERFLAEPVELEVSFATNDAGEVTGLTLRQGWTTLEARRLS